MRQKTYKLTTAALLAAIALILFIVEAQLPPLSTIPGIKIGLSNVVTVFTVYALGPAYALSVLLVRIVLGGLVTGQVSAILYSLSGGIPALLTAMVLRRYLKAGRLWLNSVFSAIVHNTGQIACAVLVTRTASLWWYLPFLVLAAVPAGALTGLAAQLVIKRLKNQK